jgi:Co/Zn/Cd efflux system component
MAQAHVEHDDCCSNKQSEVEALAMHAEVRRIFKIVLAINLAMFVAELGAGLFAHSTALIADSVDMLGDSLVYILSLYALERGLRWRAGAALVKGGLIALFGVSVAVEVLTKLVSGVTPLAGTMVLFGALALAANLSCLGLLYRFRNRDVNMSSTFECSRNDVIANVGVLLAAAGVHMFGAGWPDIAVGAIIAVLFMRSAIKVIAAAYPEWKAAHFDADHPLKIG